MGGTLKFTDTIKFSLLDHSLIKIKDHYEGAFKSNGVGTPGATHPSGMGTINNAPGQTQAEPAAAQGYGLQVRISATHAGIITANNGFYLPDRMKKGTSTFTDNFNKPVLLHHEAKQDSVGRIIASQYVDTSGAIIDQYKDMIVKDRYGKQIGVINDILINDFCNGKMPYGMAVDTVRSIFSGSILDDESYDGLGHIQILADIVDPDAIQKLLDGRYLTGSVGASTNSATCSVCRQDWTETGQCFPGNTEITMFDGSIKPIADIIIGDKVVTHTGTIGTVTKLFNRHYNGKVVVMDRIGTNQQLISTEDHPIYHSKIQTVSHRINKTDKRYFEKVLVESGFIPAKELYENEGYTSVPIINKKRSNLFSSDEAALLGLYAAEGSNTNGNCLEFCIHKKEVEQFHHYFENNNLKYHTYDKKNNQSVSCRFSDHKWKNLVNTHIGEGSRTKLLSEDIVFGSDETIKSFLGAFIDGDGHLSNKQLKVTITTASKNMGHQLLTMCNNIGIHPNFYKTKNSGGPANRDKKCYIYQIQISTSQVKDLVPYSVKLQKWKEPSLVAQQKIPLDNKIFSKFQTETALFHGTVYNIEVEATNNEHSYIANDISVHNCEHKPGGIYDSAKCFIIAGDLSYNEYSFVNKPADRHSRVLELNYNGITDSIQLENEYKGKLYEVQLQFPQYNSINSKEEEGMATKPKKENSGEVNLQDSATTEATEVTDETVTVVTTKDSDVSTEVTDSDSTNLDDKVDQVTAEKGSEILAEDNEAEAVSVESLVVKVLDKEEGFELTEEAEEKLYSALWDEIVAAVNDGEIVIEAEALNDAKLSVDKRNKLPKSSFCGPNRTFPATDSEHVVGITRLLGKIKLSDSTKKDISKNLARKAKLFDTVLTKKTTKIHSESNDALDHSRVLQMVLNVLDRDTYFSDKPVLDEKEKVLLQSIIARMAKFVGKDSFSEAAVAEGLGLSDSVEQSYVDEVAKHEEVIGKLRDRLESNRQEYSELLQDYNEVQDFLVEATSVVRKEKESNLSMLKSLHDAKIEEHDFSEISDSDLQSEIDQVLKSIDMNKITDKLGDGMSRTPKGEIDSPTEIHDNANSNNQKSKMDVEDLRRIEDTYWEIRIGKGQYAAEAFLTEMKSQNRLPQDG